MKKRVVQGIVLLVALTIIIVLLRRRTTESFTSNTEVVCPTSAERGADGHIHIKPGDRTFKTLPEYVAYLASIYAKGATCIPPAIAPNRAPIDQILGGLGIGVEPASAMKRQGATREILNTTANEQTSAQTPINKLDDYEYSRVYDSERGSRNFTDNQQRSQLLESRTLDWANLPFNSETRAKSEDSYVSGLVESAMREAKTGVLFKTMEGDTLMPPDVEAAKLREQKILASYRPTDISSHIVDSDTEAVAKLVNKMYSNDKNWEPVVTKTSDNRWEVSELRPKTRRETWADEETKQAALVNPTNTTHPNPTIEISDRLQDDPYFDKSKDMSNKKFWNYNEFREWTPGLDRMFAPTLDTKAWF